MDEIIEKAGNFGYFQALNFLFTTFIIALGGMGMFFMVFGNYNPGWSCANDTYPLGNLDTLGLRPSPSPSNITSLSKVTSECDVWRQCRNVIFGGETSTVVTEWNLMCDNFWITSMIFTVQMVGLVIGAYICGSIGDRFGRKVSMFSSVAELGIASLVCGFSNSWVMFTALRFFIGIGVGGIVSSAFLYPMEFVGQWWRSILGSVPTWSIGAIEFSLLVYIFRDWRNFHFATAGLAAAIFLPVLWMPESIRWLAVNGKVEKCINEIQRMAWWNRKGPVERDLIKQKINEIIEIQRETPKANYLDLFKTMRLRKYSIKFGLIWIILALSYYSINFGIKAFSGDFYLNLVLFSLSEIPATLVCGPMANKFGRRWSSVIFLGLSAVSCFGIVIIHFIPASGTATIAIVIATFSKMNVIAAWAVITIFSIELYPTVVRNLHSGYLNALCRIGSIFAPFMVPSDDEKIYMSYAGIGALIIISLVLIWSVSDSKGRAMTDTVDEPFGTKEELSIFVDLPEETTSMNPLQTCQE